MSLSLFFPDALILNFNECFQLFFVLSIISANYSQSVATSEPKDLKGHMELS